MNSYNVESYLFWCESNDLMCEYDIRLGWLEWVKVQ